MSQNSTVAIATQTRPAAEVSPLRAAFAKVVKKPSFILSITWLLIVVLGTVFAGLIAPYDPYDQDIASFLQLPNAAHLLGTDHVGRDLLSRLLFGGGPLLVGALIAVAVALLIGVPFGLQAGFRGGKVDAVASFFSDVLLAMPGFVVIIAIVVISNNELAIVMGFLGILISANFFRLVRATTTSTRALPYVDAARISGLSTGRILSRHILPNITGPLLVQTFVTYGICLLIASALAFLGLGLSPLTPSWGQMIYDATQYLTSQPWLLVPVGVVITLTILAVNLIGSGLRDALPHAQRQRLLTVWKLPSRPDRSRETSRRLTPDTVIGIAGSSPDGDGNRGDELLRVENLTISFPMGSSWHPVVSGVNMTVTRGTSLALVGESGCGKTMTGLALMGLVPPPGQITGGSITLDGTTLTGQPESVWQHLRGRKIALISQEPMVALDPCFTIGSQLAEAVRLHRKKSNRAAKAVALDLLRQVGIAHPEAVLRSYPHQISGGMAQRVVIALALTGDPELLIADEPTTALDVTIQAEILDLLRSLQRERGMTLIITTHDLGVVADIADEVAVMYAGQIVERGTADEVMDAPVHPYTRALVGAFPDTAQRGRPLPSVDGSVPLPQNWPSSCRFASRCAYATEECRAAPIPLIPVGVEHVARCIRIADLPGGEDVRRTAAVR